MLSDIRSIPRIMRGRGWVKGAALLDNWFRRGVTDRAPDTTTITMDWALRFGRARQVYEQLLREKIWVNEAARQQIRTLLIRKALLRPGQCSAFGALSDPVPGQDPDYINQRPAGDYTVFDDMTAALGNFNFRVVVAGGVEAAGFGRYRVVINEVGVYIRDSFDFDGDQNLGCWSEDPDLFSPIMLPGSSTPPRGAGLWDSFVASQTPLFTPVGNRDFRNWRTRNNRGGDFLVFSDLKRTTLNPPDAFDIP